MRPQTGSCEGRKEVGDAWQLASRLPQPGVTSRRPRLRDARVVRSDALPGRSADGVARDWVDHRSYPLLEPNPWLLWKEKRMELVTAVLALTATVERGVTFLRSLKMLSWVPGNWWPIFAMAGGAIFCLGWQINLTSQAMVLVPALA